LHQVLPFLSRKQPDLDRCAIQIFLVCNPVQETNRY
jgi:hypothetical protein